MVRQPNQTMAAPNIAAPPTCQPLPAAGLSRGTSIPAMPTPISTWTPATSYSVGRRHRHAATMRLTQYTAVAIITTAVPPVSQEGPVTSGSPVTDAPGLDLPALSLSGLGFPGLGSRLLCAGEQASTRRRAGRAAGPSPGRYPTH